MKKLVIAAMALALSAGVNAQDSANAGGAGASGFGGLTVASLTALGVSAAVAAAIISNNSGVTLPPEQEFELVCNEGDAAPVDGVCTTVGSTVTVTGTGTGTATTTITVPVTSTYPAIVQPVN